MSEKSQIEALAPWFHNIHLPSGEQTAPDHFLGDFPSFKWDNIKGSVPQDLTGWKVLDIGCNAGFYTLELAKRGAMVTAIDLDEHYLKQAKWVAERFGLDSQIEFRQMQVYDFAHSEEKYDLIWFMGVFYHLRYPLLALDILAGITKKMMVFQTYSLPGRETMEVPHDVEFHKRDILNTEAWPKMSFVPHQLAGDPTNWWVANHQGILSMLESAGLKTVCMPDDETYITQRESSLPTIQETWNASEYLSAVGKDWKKEISIKTGKK